MLKIEFVATNKVTNEAAKADKAAALGRNEILRSFAARAVGNINGYEAEASKLLAIAVDEASRRQAAEIVARYQGETPKAAADKLGKAADAVKSAEKAEAEAAEAVKKATKESNEAKRQSKACAELLDTQLRLAKRGQATAADIAKATAKAEAATKTAKAKAKAEAEAADKLGNAHNATKAAAAALVEAKATTEKATEAAAFAAAKESRLTIANCHESRYFRGFLLKAFNACMPCIDGVYFAFVDIKSKAAEAATPLVCNDFARLKIGAKDISAEAFPKFDASRKFTAADVTETTESGKQRFLRLYFRDEETGEILQVTGRKDAETQAVNVIISTAVQTTKFSPLCILDVLRFYLAESQAAKAKATKAQAKAEAAEARAQAEKSGNAKKSASCRRKAEAQATADKLQSCQN